MKTTLSIFLLLFLSSLIFGQEISKDRWTIKYFSSEEVSGEGANGRANQIIDGNISSYWHSRWTSNAARLPHEIQIDLGDSCEITEIKLWPRQNNCSGKPVKYEYYLSKDGENWGIPIASGSFSWKSNSDNNPQSVSFAAKKGRYIRFRQLSTYSCGTAGIGCISEISIIGVYSKLYSAKVLERSSEHVLPNSHNNLILPIHIEVYDSKPLKLSNVSFKTTGTTDLNDISSIKVYSTGVESSFNTSNLFGSTTPTDSIVNIIGDLSLSSGSNYLWVTYDIANSAKIGNTLDAKLQSVTVSDSIITPEATSTDGKRMIMGVQLTEYPVNKQLYPRDRQTNHAKVNFSGTISDVNHSTTSIKIAVLRGGVSIDTLKIIPYFSESIASFTTDYNLKAELQNYTFKVFSENDHKLNLVYSAEEVVAGDAYIITGQSNAVATIWWGETTKEIESPFIRTFGSGVSTGAYSKEWFKAISHKPGAATGNGAASDGQVGVLGLSLGKQLVDSYSVPIAVLNGAHGGKEIAFFMKNKSNPSDKNTNYGRLLIRLNESNLKNNISALIWFQGETDGSFATTQSNYISSFGNLRSSWKEDLSSLTNIYVFQIKQGCGASIQNIAVIQESQRLLPTIYPEVKVISTNPVAHKEGCHFPKSGYVTHATNLLRLLKCDLYNGTDTSSIISPNVHHIKLFTENQIAIFTDGYQGLVWENGVHSDFKLHNTPNTIVGGRVVGSMIYLTTSSPFSNLENVKVSYYGRGSVGTPAIKNTRGVGLLCFDKIQLQKGYQEINFEQIPDSLLNQDRVTLNAIATSDLPITYKSSDSSIASIDGEDLLIHKSGEITVTASQAGNELYDPATDVSIKLQINRLADLESSSYRGIKAYPNPVEDILHLSSENRIKRVEILTVIGERVKNLTQPNHRDNEWSIDVSDLSPGIYFINIHSLDQKDSLIKLLKK